MCVCVQLVGKDFREGRGLEGFFDMVIPRLLRGCSFFHFSLIDSSVRVFFFLEGILRHTFDVRRFFVRGNVIQIFQ